MNKQESVVIVHRYERTPKKLKALMMANAIMLVLSLPAMFFGFGGAGLTDLPLWQHVLFVMLKWLGFAMFFGGIAGGLALRFAHWWNHG